MNQSAKKTYELASGELKRFEVTWVELSLMGETISSRVIFGPDNAEPILGVLALETVGFVVDPSSQKLKKLPALPLKRVTAAKIAIGASGTHINFQKSAQGVNKPCTPSSIRW